VGGLVFFLLVTFVLGLASFEFVRLMERGNYRPALVFTWAFVLLGLAVAREPEGPWLRPMMAALLGSALVWQLFQAKRPAPTADWALTVVGGLYIGWMGGHMVALREMPDGIQWLLTPMLITWSADTGAYLVGSTWGRRKLVPRLSPKKTWEGTLAGWLTGVVTGGLLAAFFGFEIGHGWILGGFIGVASLFGDLGISMMKRQVGAKDSSHLIPGHGGMLDRIDSLLFTVVVGYYYIQWFVV
jgi:phosphatidate cytidylyltransferase